MEIPAHISVAEIEEKFPGFTDPSVTWRCLDGDRGQGAKQECQKLLEGLSCPRCKRTGNVVIEIWQYWRGGIVSVDSRPVPAL